MQKLLLTLLLFILIAFKTNAQSKDEIAIKAALEIQTKAWNNGDINTFMETYWKNDSLMFVGKNGPTYGWEKTKENYIKGYPDTAAMGKLDFKLISVKPLSNKYYSVVGLWHLTRSIGNIGGAFTLLLKKIKSKWVIIQDHSS